MREFIPMRKFVLDYASFLLCIPHIKCLLKNIHAVSKAYS